MTTVLSLTPAAPAADAAGIGAIEAQITSQTAADSSPCLKYSPVDGDVSSGGPTDWEGHGTEVLGSHGYPSSNGWDCWDINSRSDMRNHASTVGLEAAASPSGGATPGTPFLIAAMTHYNNTISSSVGSDFGGKLGIQLTGLQGSPKFYIDWTLWESPNQSGGCPSGHYHHNGDCDDEIQFPSNPSDTIVQIGGDYYTLVFDGFSKSLEEMGRNQCPTTRPTGTSNTFWTLEGQDTTACLYGTLERVSSLTLIKNVQGGSAQPSDWQLTAEGDQNTPVEVGGPGSTSGTTYSVPAGKYTLTESGSVPDYQLSNLQCYWTDNPSHTVGLDGRHNNRVTITDDHDVTCEFTNTSTLPQYDDLTVTKTASTSYTKAYDWSIDKSVDGDKSVNVPADDAHQNHVFNYQVKVTPSGPTYSEFTVDGTITVSNPNDTDFTGVDVTDTLSGADCTYPDDDATDVTVPAHGTATVKYSCALPDSTRTNATGTNSATATWDADSYLGTDGSATGSKGYKFADATVTTVNQTVTLSDDQHGFIAADYPGNVDGAIFNANGTVTLDADHGPYTFGYSIDWPVTANQCTDHTNTAAIDNSDSGLHQADSATVTVCGITDLDVSKNIVLSFDRTYLWELTKSADQTRVQADADGNATFDYTVTATPAGSSDGNWSMQGEITVTNHNAKLDITADVTDDIGFTGVQCSIDGIVDNQTTTPTDGQDVTIPAGSDVVFHYTCTFPDNWTPKYQGTNTADVTWADTYPTPTQTASGEVDFDADDWVETPINRTITIKDSNPAFADAYPDVADRQATWNDDKNPTTFEYTVTHQIDEGQCESFDNTATIKQTGQTATETVTGCHSAGLTATKTADTQFTRTYDWTVQKSADHTQKIVDPDTGDATFNYTVTATPGGFTDSDWAVAGDITVTNPNDFKSVTATVTDEYAGDACTVTGGDNGGHSAEIAAGKDHVFHYSCTLTAATDGTNTATITWDGDQTTTATHDVTFGDPTTPINKTVHIWDDKTDPAHPVDLGTVTWNSSGAPITVGEYSLDLGSTEGTCTPYTNTAWADLDGDEQQDSGEADADVTVNACATDGLTVTKTATGSFDRLYQWTVDKSVDDSDVTVAGTDSHEFGYTVTATPNGVKDSDWAVTGSITISNPNDFESADVTVADALDVGVTAQCVIKNGTEIVGADDTVTVPQASDKAGPGKVTLTYTCTTSEKPEYGGGTNTATVTWDDVEYTSNAVDVTFAVDGETDKSIKVYDNKTGADSDAEVLFTATWGEPDTQSKTYDLELGGTAGQCTNFTNTAWADTASTTDDNPSDSQDVALCVESPITVSKSATGSFDRAYHWDITKNVTDTTIETAENSATFHYAVDAIPDGYTDSGWTVTGAITVTNPNQFEKATVDVVDTLDVGVDSSAVHCTLTSDGADVTGSVTIGKGSDVTLDYTCDITSRPTVANDGSYVTGSNTATATWTDPTVDSNAVTYSSDPADVDFTLGGETDKTVDVVDDQTDPANPVTLGQATWNADGTATPFTYPLTLDGAAGQCENYTNTAWVDVTGDDDPTASQQATVCVEKGLTIAKTVDATFDRAYHWTIDKSVDDSDATVGADGKATYHYTVKAQKDGYADSNWDMHGTITVGNPNTYTDGSIDITSLVDTPDNGVTCTVDSDIDVTMAPGDSRTFDYSCSITDLDEADYTGTNTATVGWTDADGKARTATFGAPIDFTVDHETDKSITVHDDKAVSGKDHELGAATWAGTDADNTFTYDLDLQGVGGQCVDYTNTAWLELAGGTGDTDTADVNLCVDGDLSLAKNVTSTTQLADGTWQTDYTITVTNNADYRARYDLTDDLQFGGGLTPQSATWKLASDPTNVNGSWMALPGTTSATLATGSVLGAAGSATDTDVYHVQVIADVASGVIGTDAAQCSGDNGTAGGGFLNAAHLTAQGTDLTRKACSEPAAPMFTKTTSGLTGPDADGLWTVTYRLVVDNSDNDVQTSYSLTDSPDFAAGVAIVGSPSVAAVDAGTPTPSNSWDGDSDTTVISDQTIGAGATHTYTVAVTVNLKNFTDDSLRQCSESGGAGHGLFNGGQLTSGNDTYDDSACAGIPDPTVKTSKTVTSVNQSPSGSYLVTYTVKAENTGTIGTSATIKDVLDFGDGISIDSQSVTEVGTAPAPNSNWDGTSAHSTIVSGVPLAGGATIAYTVTATATVTSDATEGDLTCATDGDTAGGFLNTATFTVNGAATEHDACAAPATPTFSKDAGTLTNNHDGTFTVTYTLTAKNGSDQTMYYDLSDTPQFASGVRIVSATVTNTSPGGIVTNGEFDATTDPVVVTGQQLSAHTTHVYTVSVIVDLTGTTDDSVRQCAAQGDGAGHGLYNEAALQSAGDTVTDDACIDIPTPSITVDKTVTGTTQNADGTWTVTYDVTASNTGDIGGSYDLTDTLEYGSGLTPSAADWTLDGVGTTGSWTDPATTPTTTLAVGRALPGGTSDVYHVTVTAAVDAGVLGTDPAQCNGETGTAGGGFLNAATVKAYGDSQTAKACAEPVAPDVNKAFVGSSINADGGWDVTYTITVTNSSDDATIAYSLSDTPSFPAGLDITDVAVTQSDLDGVVPGAYDSGSGVLTIIPAGSAVTLGAGDSHTYTIVVSTATPEASLPGDVLGCTVDMPAPGYGFFNTATAATGNDTITDNACGGIPAWTIEKSSATTNAQPGDTITYMLTATNTGPVAVTGASAVDTLPEDVTLVTPLADGLTDNGDGTLTWAVPEMASDADPVTVSYSVTVDADAAGTTQANLVVPGTPGGECLPGEQPVESRTDVAALVAAGDTSDTAGCTVETDVPAWTLGKTSDPESGSTVETGSTISYTLTVTNNGPGVLNGAIVVDDLTKVLDGATFGGFTDGSATRTDNTLTWEVPDGLAAGETASITYTVTVDSDANGMTLTNVATPGNPAGQCVADDGCTTTHTVPPLDVVLGISKVASAETVPQGDEFSYSITVSNSTDGTADPVTLSDPIPADVSITGITTDTADPVRWQDCVVTGTDANGFGGTLTCTLSAPLTAGQVAPTVVLDAVMSTHMVGPGTVTNTATVTWENPDQPDLGAQSARDSADVEVPIEVAPTTEKQTPTTTPTTPTPTSTSTPAPTTTVTSPATTTITPTTSTIEVLPTTDDQQIAYTGVPTWQLGWVAAALLGAGLVLLLLGATRRRRMQKH